MTNPAQRLEALRERMRAAPPNGMTPEQVDAWFITDRATILAQIVDHSRGHAYRVGSDWYVDAGMLESVAAQGGTVRTRSGWAVALSGESITCERVDPPAPLPGQRGSLYRCTGGQLHAERLLGAGGKAATAVLAGSFDAWPSRQLGPPQAPRSGTGCACTVTAGGCGCTKEPVRNDIAASVEDALEAAGLDPSPDQIHALHDLALYRPKDAGLRDRALRVLTAAGFRPQVRGGQLVVRNRLPWS